MNVRTLPRTTVEQYLRLARVPFDAAIGWLPGNGTGHYTAGCRYGERIRSRGGLIEGRCDG